MDPANAIAPALKAGAANDTNVDNGHSAGGGNGMKQVYFRAMDAINGACLFVAGACLVIITLIVPYGVFTRYVLNSAASWPEPLAVLLMIVLSFLSAVVCYREHLHIGVGVLPACSREPCEVAAGLAARNLHARDQSLHAGLGHQAGGGDLVPEHRRVPDRHRRHDLPADSASAARSPSCS